MGVRIGDTCWEVHPTSKESVIATVVSQGHSVNRTRIDFLRPQAQNFIFYVHPSVAADGNFMGYGANDMRRKRVMEATLPLLCGRKDWAVYAPRYNGVSVGGIGKRLFEIAGLARGVRDVALAFRSFERDVRRNGTASGKQVVVSGFSQGAVVLSLCIRLGFITLPDGCDLVLLGCFAPSFFPFNIDIYPERAEKISLAWKDANFSELVAESTCVSFRLKTMVLFNCNDSFEQLLRKHYNAGSGTFVVFCDETAPFVFEKRADGRLYPRLSGEFTLSQDICFAAGQHGKSESIGWGAHSLDAVICPAPFLRRALTR